MRRKAVRPPRVCDWCSINRCVYFVIVALAFVTPTVLHRMRHRAQGAAPRSVTASVQEDGHLHRNGDSKCADSGLN